MLREHAKDLISNLEQEISMLTLEDSNRLQQLEKAFHLAEKAVISMRSYLDTYKFQSEEEEISFFKLINPLLLKEAFYYAELFAVESNKPLGSNKKIRSYYSKAIRRIVKMLGKHKHLYNYVNLNESKFDHFYFLRNSENNLKQPTGELLYMDTKYVTLQSYNLGKIYAWIQVVEQLQEDILLLDGQQGISTSVKQGLTWTAPKVQLIELIYALKASGVFNNGNADIKQIANALGCLFDKKLTDYYRTFQEIRGRKKSRTVFLDIMQERLVKWMEEGEGLN
ncbi:RteC protein [Belliella baltica DSM 15883]|uniref:RteC protein n=1 Tax=Belliella baltica (strain DSM 15883 / CIP 108006 / LMG 21964 / BA134) TaxID=866536 RepID=I3Z3A7_BELBD|nr:RteC domain-containing protein [Belliella baltica]AFL83725.1 RteC protein [Belliella baltica DSM 15883]